MSSGLEPDEIGENTDSPDGYIDIPDGNVTGSYETTVENAVMFESMMAVANRYEVEPNDTMSKATSISNNTTISDANIHVTSDVDYYRFTLPSTSNVTIDLTNIPIGCDYELELYNSSGAEIASSRKVNNNPERITMTLNSGTYYILVYSYMGSSSLFYRLTLATAVSVNPDRYEPNDSIAQATSIATNAIIDNANIHTTTDQDYYKFQIYSQMSIAFDLNNIPSGWDYDLSLYNSTGVQIGYSARANSSPEYISANFNPGTYYAHVYPYRSTSVSSAFYRLALRYQKTLSNVPLYVQRELDTCGSASGIMILKSYGITVSEEVFKNRAYEHSGDNRDYTMVYAVTRALNEFLEKDNKSTQYQYVNVSSYDTQKYEELVLKNILNAHPVQPVLRIPSNSGVFPYSSTGHYVVIAGMTYPDNNGYKAVVNDSHHTYFNIYHVPIDKMLSYNKAHSSFIICVNT